MNTSEGNQPGELMAAHANYRDFTELQSVTGWQRFHAEHAKTLKALEQRILCTLPAGDERDAEIAKYRVIAEVIKMPERAIEGAKLVLQNSTDEFQEDGE